MNIFHSFSGTYIKFFQKLTFQTNKNFAYVQNEWSPKNVDLILSVPHFQQQFVSNRLSALYNLQNNTRYKYTNPLPINYKYVQTKKWI